MFTPRSAALWVALLCLLPGAPEASIHADGAARPTQPAATTGTYSALVLFAKFAGEAAGDDRKPIWADDLFAPDVAGSFTHFYNEMSGGQLRVSGQVLERRYASRSPASEYLAPAPGTLGDFARFNLEILQQADADVDMGRFDNDGPDGLPNSGDDDGYVDVVFINLLTAPRDFFISGATGIATLGLNTDFLSDDPAAGGGVVRVRSQFSGFGGTTQRGHVFTVTAATMCHEFGHVLGLPDLFDQSTVTAEGELDSEEDSAGIGKWGLMGLGTLGWGVEDGPNAFSAWSLAQLGWLGQGNLRLVEVASTQAGIVLEPIDRGGDVLKVRLTSDEYFLIENRQATDSYYNRNIPAGGLLVWHVDERADNDEERHKQVDLVCADGLFADRGFPGSQPDPVAGRDNLDFWSADAAYANDHNGNRGDATDPFDGVRFRRLAFDTNPGLRGHAGGRRAIPLGVVLDDITDLGSGRIGLDVLFQQPVEGNISGSQRWSGEVSVDGDLVIEPGAVLTLAAGTRVVFAGTDSRQTGFDAGRCELIAYGDLVIEATSAAPVRLEAASSRDWLGLLLLNGNNPGLESRAEEGGLVLAGARLGIVRSRLPPGLTQWTRSRRVPWDLVIPAGAELRLASGIEVRFAAEDLGVGGRVPSFAELVVEGGLTIAGSAASPATLTVDSRRPDALWYGVRIVAGGSVEATGLDLSQAVRGISGEVSQTGALRLADSRLSRLLYGLDVDLFRDAAVDRTSFEEITANGVRVGGFGRLRLRGSTIEGAGQEGVLTSNASLELIDSRVTGSGAFDSEDPRSGLTAAGGAGQRIELWKTEIAANERHGLQLEAWEGVVELHETSLTANRQDGIRVDGAERVVFEDAEVTRNRGVGARLLDTVSELWTTDFEDNVRGGVVIDGGTVAVEMSRFVANSVSVDNSDTATVRSSEFVNTSVALHTTRSSPSLIGNRFEGNVTALRVDGPPVPGPVRDNVFIGNGTAVDNRSGIELDARGNYWGTSDSTQIAGQLSGTVAWTPFLTGEPMQTAVHDDGAGAPAAFVLHGARPNPFNAATTIGFELPGAAPVELLIVDALGRRVRRLLGGRSMQPGHHQAVWTGVDDEGRPAASGVYLFRLRAGTDGASGRVLLLR